MVGAVKTPDIKQNMTSAFNNTILTTNTNDTNNTKVNAKSIGTLCNYCK